MKNYSISGVIALIAGGMLAVLFISMLASCSVSRPATWYRPLRDGGCQSSRGMGGY